MNMFFADSVVDHTARQQNQNAQKEYSFFPRLSCLSLFFVYRGWKNVVSSAPNKKKGTDASLLSGSFN